MMRISSLFTFCFLSVVSAQTVYLAGDSTMALGGGGSGTQGWGVPLSQFLTIPVVNDAVAGESARSYSDEGRFTSLINSVKSGDFVVHHRSMSAPRLTQSCILTSGIFFWFGHNDVSAGAVDNGKQDAVGDGYNITSTVTAANGTQILIHSFAFYIENAVNAIKAKGGIPIISSLTPDNIWTTTSPIVIAAGGRFVTYAQSVGVDTSITYVDHYDYVAQAYNKLGQTAVTAFYPIDHLHTNANGALVVAEAFVRGLLCGTSTLKNFVNAAGKAVPSTRLLVNESSFVVAV
ncbi:Carbohydrate esterase family 12 protein [Mycena venus]|uniref:Carbohydrate esterase family 12 protein n=1 Tax=Mycena venus TaxID=2733690 RepID=A0A8H6XW86_9AGAR|nr:Carbohydrate esterase family 12 protein [Mycena venus]